MQVAVDDVIFSSAGADKNFGIGISAFSIGGGPTFAILSSTTSPLGTAQSGGFIAVAESFQACTANPSTATLTMNWTYTTNSTQGATAFVRVREIKNALPIVGPIHDDTVTMYGIPSAEAVGNIYFQQHDSHITLTGIPSAEAIGNLAILGPAAPCDCPDPVAVTLPTILDTVEAPETGRDILVDPTTNNLALTETGDLALVAGIDSIAQDLRHRCRTFTGEWFLALDAGLPWFTDILGVKKLNLATVRSLLRALIEDTPGVKNILSLDVALATATRALAITFRVDTDLGEFVETLTTPLAEEP